MPRQPKPPKQPGDLIIDRYAPNATPEQREAGRSALLNYARVLERIGARLLAENPDAKPAPLLEADGNRFRYDRERSVIFRTTNADHGRTGGS
jgi:hypothetical protein